MGQKAMTADRRHVGEHIQDCDLELDDAHFENCILRKCRLIYRGTGELPNFVVPGGNDLADCDFMLGGNAQQAILFCQMLTAMGLPRVVDQIMADARKPLWTALPSGGKTSAIGI